RPRGGRCVVARRAPPPPRPPQGWGPRPAPPQNPPPLPPPTRLSRQGRGDVRLAGPRVADHDDRLPAVDELAAHQLGDEYLVQGWLGGEVEVLQRLERREAGRLQPPLGRPPLPVEQLQLGQLEQEGQVVGVIGRAPLGHLLALGQDGRQSQRLEVVLQEHRAGRLSLLHAPPPSRRAW